MRKKEEFLLKYRAKTLAHGRATVGTGRANFMKKGESWLGMVRHGCATAGTGRAKSMGS